MTEKLMPLKQEKINRLIPTAILLLIFAIDCLLGNWVKLMHPSQASSWTEWKDQVIMYNTAKSYFQWMPYILLLLFARKPKWFRLEGWDECLCVVMLMSAVITTADWYVNSNWRPMWLDWWAFGVVILLITYFKIRNVYK